MKNTHIILGGLLVVALLCSVGTAAALDDNVTGAQGTGDISDEIAPYNGPIGADSPVYGLNWPWKTSTRHSPSMIPSGWKNALTMHNSALLKYGGMDFNRTTTD